MKTIKIILKIFTAICAALLVFVDLCIMYIWKQGGCGVASVILGVLFYTVCIVGLWYIISKDLRKLGDSYDDKE